MANKHKFEFEDGTVVEFENFDNVTRHNVLYGGQPAKIPGQSVGIISFYVSKELYDWDRDTRWDRQSTKVKTSKYVKDIQVAILAQKAAIGLPTGSYVPIKWNPAMNRFDVFLIGLTNEKLIIDSRIASIDTIEKMEKIEKEIEAENAADNE